MNKRIDFSYNWNNKLDCTVFTTIRLWNDTKYVVGEIYDIYENNVFKCEAMCMSLKKMMLDTITNELAMIDTSYNKAQFTKVLETMYKNKAVNIHTHPLAVLFLKKQKPIKN